MSHTGFQPRVSVTFWLWFWSGFRTLCHEGPRFLCNMKSLWRLFEFWDQNIPMFHVEFLVLACPSLSAALHHCPSELCVKLLILHVSVALITPYTCFLSINTSWGLKLRYFILLRVLHNFTEAGTEKWHRQYYFISYKIPCSLLLISQK